MINPETGKRYKTRVLNGTATEEERQHAFERLAMNEGDSEEPLDYIFSVEILNEGWEFPGGRLKWEKRHSRLWSEKLKKS